MVNVTPEDLKELGYHQLLILQRDIETAIKSLRSENKKSVKDKILILAHESGYKLHDLFPEISTKETQEEKKITKKRFFSKKYINPNNENEIWNGAGARPKWLKELIRTGTNLEDLLFQEAA